jgi:hypothetical protein
LLIANTQTLIRIKKYSSAVAAIESSPQSSLNIGFEMAKATIVIIIELKKENIRPLLRAIAISLVLFSPFSLAVIACTPEVTPNTNPVKVKVIIPAVPTAAIALGPSLPTIIVSTRLKMFWEVMPAIMGMPRLNILEILSFGGRIIISVVS